MRLTIVFFDEFTIQMLWHRIHHIGG